MTYCVIGAGAAGLATARQLRASSIPFEVVERERDVGGLWDASLPHGLSLHPPDLLQAAERVEYLRSYAKEFGLYQFIRFGREVRKAERGERNDWRVTFGGGESRVYSGLIVAAGIHWVPNLPQVPGEFEGEWLHSSRYKTPEILRGKRVLVVGAGNSGCDIAVEAGQHAARTFLSVRLGYHYIPKYAFGRPIDQVGELGHRLGLPLSIRRPVNQLLLRVVVARSATARSSRSPTSTSMSSIRHTRTCSSWAC